MAWCHGVAAMIETWESKAKHLEAALEKGWSIDDVKAEIDAGRAQFWPLPNSAVVTQVLEQPQRNVLRIWLAGGDMDELQFAQSGHAVDYARERGCSVIEVDGRKGWSRALKGFQETRRVLEMELL